MQQTEPQAPSIAGDLIRDLEAEAQKTRAVLEAVPEAKLDWKPHEKSMTLRALASHLAENPAWIPGMLEDELDFAALKDYRPFAAASRAELLKALERNLETCVQALRGREDAQLQSSWTMRNGDQLLMRAPKGEAIRSIGIHHWVHHRGQLTVYLRLLGAPVPATYGPTADRPSFGT